MESFKDSAVGESERKKVGGRGSRRRGGVHRRTSEGEGEQASGGLVVGKETVQKMFVDTDRVALLKLNLTSIDSVVNKTLIKLIPLDLMF